MAIARRKRRYFVTLTPERVEQFQALTRRLNLPPATMSNAFDEVLPGLIETFQIVADQGASGITDIVTMMGRKMDQLHKEEEKIHEEKQKRNPDTR